MSGDLEILGIQPFDLSFLAHLASRFSLWKAFSVTLIMQASNLCVSSLSFRSACSQSWRSWEEHELTLKSLHDKYMLKNMP